MRAKPNPDPDWDPRDPGLLADHLAASDGMIRSCPVAYSEFLGWSVFRHGDVRRVLLDPRTFSSVVSTTHVSVPNGLDPPAHTAYRSLVERYFTPARIEAFEPLCRQLCQSLVSALPSDVEMDVMASFAEPFALEAQCAFVGWSTRGREPLRRWMIAQQAATLRRDRAELDALAAEFDQMVLEQIQTRAGKGAIAMLALERVNQRLLDPAEICSILRNWTVGELGTIAASLGILLHTLALDPQLQERLRAEPSALPYAIEEILRMSAPLLSNRRVANRDCLLGTRAIRAGDRVTVMWAGANRDPEVFCEPERFRWDRDLDQSLLYGAGIHACPGAALARLELRLAMEELLRRTHQIHPGHASPEIANYPGAGFRALPLVLSSSSSSSGPEGGF